MASYERYREYATASAADLAANNPVLEAGQLAVESDTGRIKVGDGSTAYTSLPSPTDFTAVWNSAGTTFTGIKFNVTDTASAAGSLLMDLRVGGASRFRVGKTGSAFLFGNSLSFGTGFDVGGVGVEVGAVGLTGINTNATISWRSTNSSGGVDLIVTRDAANTLAQRNSTNAQSFRVYNTYTDASNYERLSIAWPANACIVSLENAGTGAARSLYLRSTNLYFGGALGANHWVVITSGHFVAGTDNVYDIGNAGGGRPRNLFLGSYAQLSEMTAPAAPAANSVRIYAEDNGSGKTQLMALFATGAAQQIAIEP